MKILIYGATGRMGREIIAASLKHSDMSVIGGMLRAGSPDVGTIFEGLESELSDSWHSNFDKADVIIDFSSASGTEKAIALARDKKMPIVIGTTGISDKLEQDIVELAKGVPVLRTRNTSVGVNALALLLEQAAKMLGQDFETELVELHHKHKTDSPSGTALLLLEHVAKAKSQNLSDVITTGRSGTELSRDKDEIGAQAVRGGDVAGEHTVYFFGEGERLELTHRATNRSIFADGALKGARWLVENKKAGFYSMLDVLGAK